MKTIHKFVVPAYPGIHEIEVPGFVEWLDAGEQDGKLVMWAKVLTGFDATKRREVTVAWTGQPMPDTSDPHFRTVQIGRLVHHIFVRPVSP